MLYHSCIVACAQQTQLHDGEFYAEINGVKHWYKIAGAQLHTTPLIVIHGGPGGNHYVLERIAGKELEKFSTIIYYEQRGSGRSAEPSNDSLYSINILVDDLDALRKYLGINKFIPLGYSFGASLAMEYALVHPQYVEKLILESFATLQDSAVLLGQMANFYTTADSAHRKQLDSILSLNGFLQDKYNLFWNTASRDNVVRFLFHEPGKGEEVFNMWSESKLVNTGKMMKALMREHRPVYLLDDAARIKMPVLILAGLYDRNWALTNSLRLHEDISNSTLIIFENSAHFPDVEETEKFVDAIHKWLSKY